MTSAFRIPTHTTRLVPMLQTPAANGNSARAARLPAPQVSMTRPGPFRYDATKGFCVDAAGQKGQNKLDAKALFGEASAFPTDMTWPSRSAECIDFLGFDFYHYLHPDQNSQYANLDSWDFRGARFRTSDMRFVSVMNAQLQGADFVSVRLGYTTISGLRDRFTLPHSECSVDDDEGLYCRN